MGMIVTDELIFPTLVALKPITMAGTGGTDDWGVSRHLARRILRRNPAV